MNAIQFFQFGFIKPLKNMFYFYFPYIDTGKIYIETLGISIRLINAKAWTEYPYNEKIDIRDILDGGESSLINCGGNSKCGFKIEEFIYYKMLTEGTTVYIKEFSVIFNVEKVSSFENIKTTNIYPPMSIVKVGNNSFIFKVTDQNILDNNKLPFYSFFKRNIGRIDVEPN